MFQRIALAVLFLTLAASSAGAKSQTAAAIDPLNPGLHLGYGTFAPVPAEAAPELEERIAEATNAGMDVARVMVDWSEIEPGAGGYDLATLEDQLERVPAGSRIFLTLGVTDTDRYAVPDDLLASDTELSVPLDDPDVIARYLAVLDTVLPDLIADHGLFALSVANEPDDLLTSRPAEEAASLASFTRAVSAHAKTQFPGLAVTLTISGPGVTNAPAFLPDLIDATDIAAFNWSCLDFSTFNVTGVNSIPTDVEMLLQAADGRDIVIQELSCASGYTDQASSIGSSPEMQAEWFESFFTAMREAPQFRAAFVLDLVDWPSDLATQFTDFLRAEGLSGIADQYEEFLATWGLLRFDLQPKPAWDVFLNNLWQPAASIDAGRHR